MITSRVNDMRFHRERDEQRAEAMKMLAQPEQEPCKTCNGAGEVETGIGMMVCDDCHGITYTNPPQRKPLMDGEIWDLHIKMSAAINCKLSDLIELTRAVEAAHGIKE